MSSGLGNVEVNEEATSFRGTDVEVNEEATSFRGPNVGIIEDGAGARWAMAACSRTAAVGLVGGTWA